MKKLNIIFLFLLTVLLVLPMSHISDAVSSKQENRNFQERPPLKEMLSKQGISQFEDWFKTAFNTGYGIWIGKGVSDQGLFRIAAMNKEMMQDVKTDMGYLISESRGILCKFIDFISDSEGDQNGE